MNTLSTLAQHSPEELLNLPDGPRYELIDGQLVERKMGARTSLVAASIIHLLRQHAHTHGLGLIFATDCGYQIFANQPGRVRFPDASFIRRGRLPNDEPPEGHVRTVPDLVVEVVSPNDLAEELEAKVEDYLQAGVSLMWVVYPATRSVLVYRPDGRCTRLTAAQELEGEDVLPGFRCRVEELFATL